jgi:hypothetical protein
MLVLVLVGLENEVLKTEAAAETILAVIDGMYDGTPPLYEIDAATGIAGVPRDLNRGLLGLALSSERLLYGVDRLFFCTVDLDAGAATVVGDHLPSHHMYWDIAAEPRTDKLFTLVTDTPPGGVSTFMLATIDAQTGDLEIVADDIAPFHSMAFDSDGTLFGLISLSNQLLTLDTTDGSVLSQIPLSHSLGWRTEIAISPRTGELYALECNVPGTSMLYRIDKYTGEVLAIGDTGIEAHVAGLLVVPEPAMLLILLLSAVALRGRYARSRASNSPGKSTA